MLTFVMERVPLVVISCLLPLEERSCCETLVFWGKEASDQMRVGHWNSREVTKMRAHTWGVRESSLSESEISGIGVYSISAAPMRRKAPSWVGVFYK